MGMTIDECIDELEWIKSTGIYPYGNTQDKLHTDDYIDIVIDIMRKYQKIVDLVYLWSSWNEDNYRLHRLREIIDGRES